MPPPRGHVSRATRCQPHPEGSRATRRAAAKSASNQPSRFLALPAELRVKIYSLLFFNLTTILRRKLPIQNQRRNGGIHWRYANEPQGPSKQVRYCNALPMSGYTQETRKLPRGHKFSLTGILFVNKQIHIEAAAVLYEESTFFFERFEIARSFLRTVGKINLEAIRSLTFQHETQFASTATDLIDKRDADSLDKKARADKSFSNMCRQFVAALPNLRSLRLTVELVTLPDEIVPEFRDRGSETFSIERYEGRSWFQAIRHFSELKELQNVIIKFKIPNDKEMRENLADEINGDHGDPHFQRLFTVWLRYQKSLHHSLGLVVGRLIMGQVKDEAWKSHLQKLAEYRAFCFNPLEPVAKTMEGREYKAFLAECDSKAKREKQEVVTQPVGAADGW
ncbi:hypothetical protein LTR17_020923 [Elasticomyces elasticus]|nr:hypothetical protein LTR17_020923 [Elasticomyces elasticus]